MEPKLQRENATPDQESQIRAALDKHWQASASGDVDTEHEIYREDAVLEYPQSGERIRGRRNIQESRTVQPSSKRFTVRRIIGSGNLWVTEYTINYKGQSAFTVSIMEFRNDAKVVHETQYFTDPFEAPAWRKQWVQQATQMPS